jgi:hypothetical protein
MWRRAGIAPGAHASLMTAEERAALAALPAHVTIHRAFEGHEWRGLTWGLERAAAARRPPGATVSRLATATVPRSGIVALFASHGTCELVVLPDGLRPVVTAIG